MDWDRASDDETAFIMRISDSNADELLLPVLPSSIAECCAKVEDDDSVWSRSTRIASMSWDWDEPPLNHPHIPSPTSGRYRGRAESYCSTSSNAPPFCRPTSLSFAVGESARPEYSSPHSPGFVFREDVEGHEIEGLLDGESGDSNISSISRANSDIIARRHRSAFPFQQRGSTTDQQKDLIRPIDLSEGEYDYQGIPWPRFSISRTDYRSKRVREYSNYNNVNWTAQLEMKRRLELTKVHRVRNDIFFFNETYRTVNPTIDHFQLRHLLWNTSNSASYLVSNSALYEFNKKSRATRRVQACNPQQLASCHVDHGLAVTGSFDSEVKVTRLVDYSPQFALKVSGDPNSITNHVVIADPATVVVANNDSHVSEISLDCGGRIISKHKWTTAVNHASVSPNGQLLCLSGDRCEISLMERRSGDTVMNLEGHLDFSFCSSWRGDGTVCTGSQDGTCRIWDLRKTGRGAVACLGSLLGAVRCCKFSPNHRYLAISEPADFVHVYDVSLGLKEVQLLDFFGNIGGIAFSPDSSKLSVSLADTMFGCLIDFQVGSLPLNTAKQ